MLNMNNKPNMIAIIPIMMFNAENPIAIEAIPNITRLTPIRMDTVPALMTGKIIKINPKIIDNIPDALLASIVFPPKICFIHFSSENYLSLKSNMLFTYLTFLFYSI